MFAYAASETDGENETREWYLAEIRVTKIVKTLVANIKQANLQGTMGKPAWSGFCICYADKEYTCKISEKWWLKKDMVVLIIILELQSWKGTNVSLSPAPVKEGNLTPSLHSQRPKLVYSMLIVVINF